MYVWDSILVFPVVLYKSLISAPSYSQDCLCFLEVGKDNVTEEARKERQQELLLADQSTGY